MIAQPVKIIVVEDELILLENLCRKITAVSPDFQITGRAFNGREALALIREEKPDIVFTDIRMPLMDGLELADILYREYPEVHVVIVSGYDDFEYARKALTCRVHDYLLKPLKNGELEELLDSLRASVVEKRESEMYSLLQRQLSDSCAQLSKESHIDLDRYCFYPFLICFGNLYLQELPGREAFSLINREPRLFDKVFRGLPFAALDYRVLPYLADNLYLLITNTVPVETAEMARYIQEALIQAASPATVNISFPGGSGKTDFQGLRRTIAALYNRMKEALVIGRSSLFPVCETGGKKEEKMTLPPAILPQESIHYLQTVILSGNSGEFKRLLLQYFSEWQQKEYPQQWIEKVLSQLLYLLQRNLYFSDETYGEMYRHVFCFLESDRQFTESGEKIAEELGRWIDRLQTVPSEIESTIEELDSFIRQHYRENLNLSDLADKYHFNHSYLTKTFKKQKGISPLKLINTLRMEDAKELLLNEELSVREISEMLGFSNQHYFSRMFKEATGQTPVEYRNAVFP